MGYTASHTMYQILSWIGLCDINKRIYVDIFWHFVIMLNRQQQKVKPSALFEPELGNMACTI